MRVPAIYRKHRLVSYEGKDLPPDEDRLKVAFDIKDYDYKLLRCPDGAPLGRSSNKKVLGGA